MRIFSKKTKHAAAKHNTTNNPIDKKLHNIFRWGAVLVIAYVIYTIYTGPSNNNQSLAPDLKQAKIINAKQGVLVYIPQKLVGDGGDINVSNENLELKISVKNKAIKNDAK